MMIIEFVFNMLKGALIWLLGLVPVPEVSSLSGLDSVINSFVEMLQVISYFLPVGDIVMMLRIWLGIYTFNIVWKLIQRLWDALPLT